ncbi:MAG: cob(I)yrinic acid a,c-diamide adenosyltransferase [Saprospiraceae bacterium]
MFKIYTKTGDTGETALFGGRRIPKHDLRVEAYGAADELNAFIGVLADSVGVPAESVVQLREIQARLFSLGAYLASDPDKKGPPMDLRDSDVEWLEQAIDAMDTELEPLRNFIIPGGCLAVAQAHVCRTVCRRAERRCTALHELQPLDELALRYLNRLSDYFFTLARYIARKNNAEEVAWRPRN